MRILLIAPQVPWPMQQGTAIRNFHIAHQLAKRHDVTLLAFGDAASTAEPLEAAGIRIAAVPPPPHRALARRMAELITTLTPDLARRLATPAMANRLAAIAAETSGDEGDGFDVVQVEGLEMAPYGLTAQAQLAEHGRAARLIYDAHNAEWVLQNRAWAADIRRVRGWPGAAYSLIQTWKLRRFERRLLAAADATVAVSDADARSLLDVAPGARLTVVPNGVDTAHYEPSDPAGVDPALCVFTGKMDFRPNVDAVAWFCRRVWPQVQARRPDARLAIVGRDPVRRVGALAGPDIEVTGIVEDVRPWLDRAGIVVVPMRVGGGTRLKVLEAMAVGKAIVATTMAVEGLAVTHGRELVLADAVDSQASAITDLMSDAGARAALGRRARALVERSYRWEHLVPDIETLYRWP